MTFNDEGGRINGNSSPDCSGKGPSEGIVGRVSV